MKIGQGSFGTIFRTFDRDSKQLCATKFEKRDDRPGTISLLQREIKVLLEMKGISG
jgi:serine/threonine protein kinase